MPTYFLEHSERGIWSTLYRIEGRLENALHELRSSAKYYEGPFRLRVCHGISTIYLYANGRWEEKEG